MMEMVFGEGTYTPPPLAGPDVTVAEFQPFIDQLRSARASVQTSSFRPASSELAGAQRCPRSHESEK